MRLRMRGRIYRNRIHPLEYKPLLNSFMSLFEVGMRHEAYRY
jgi:hypothetical protein